MAKSSKKEEPVVETQPVATEALATTAPAALAKASDYGDDMGMGLEDAGKGLIPWIVLFQSNSPQVEEKLIHGAEAGMLFNSSTNELIDAEVEPGKPLDSKGLIIQPVYVKRVWVEWIPREKGGGVAKRYPFDKTDGFDPFIVDAIKRNGGSEIFGKENPLKGTVDPSNNVVDTRYFYFNILTEDATDVASQGVMACSSSKIKKLDQLVTSVRVAKNQPSFFATLVRLTTFQDKQKKPPNKVFKNIQFNVFDRTNSGLQRFVPEVLLSMSEDLYAAGRALYMDVKSGARTADLDKEGINAASHEGEDSKNERAF